VYLVKHPGLDSLLHDARGAHGDVVVTATAFACSMALWTPSVTNVNGDPS
jgi:hypothetical protein